MGEILDVDGEDIVQARISGESVSAIAKRFSCTATEVSAVLDRFADLMIDDKTRKHTLALELARLDQLQRTFYAQAMGGDAAAGALVAKLVERRCTMLGLYTPPAMTLQVVEAQAPKQTSTEKIRDLLDNILKITQRERALITQWQDEGTATPEIRSELNELRAARGKPPLPDDANDPEA